MSEKAYTPRAEFQCDGSETHYQGCKCHEDRRNARVTEIETAYGLCHARAEQLAKDLDTATARVQELEAALREILRHTHNKTRMVVIADAALRSPSTPADNECDHSGVCIRQGPGGPPECLKCGERFQSSSDKKEGL